MGLGALRTSLEIKHPNVTVRMQTILFIRETIMVLAKVDVNIGSFQIAPLPSVAIVRHTGVQAAEQAPRQMRSPRRRPGREPCARVSRSLSAVSSWGLVAGAGLRPATPFYPCRPAPNTQSRMRP